jgi:excinuclease ABC subunit C
MDMVAKNARQGLASHQIKQFATMDMDTVLKEMKSKLSLPSVPMRIEGYDISNIRGTRAVGSMVVFDKGLPKSDHYRRFKVKSVVGINDYAMMQEALRRRFKRQGEIDKKWSILPDLVLIDGGKGHLNAALEVLQEVGLPEIPLASLAKENEQVFIPNKSRAIDIPQTSAVLHLLQRIRDEAHRFALGYHQKLRRKESVDSALDDIPGIGPKRKKALLRKLGSTRNIKEASTSELSSVEGITTTLAQKIKEYL